VFGETFYVIHEDVRETGRGLAKALLGAIEGRPVTTLQTLIVPDKVTRQTASDERGDFSD
jgi:LacI family transcriptional regulator